MSQSVPRNLPGLTRDALLGGWEVHVTYRGRMVWLSVHRGGEQVSVKWIPDGPGWSLWDSLINGEKTPYWQCTRLIRSPEGATS